MKIAILALICFTTTQAQAMLTTSKERYDRSRSSSQNGQVTIELNKTGQTLTKMFYGSQIESGSPIPSKQLVDELQLGRLRVGGNEYDVFNWQTGLSVTQAGDIKRIHKLEDLANTFKNLNVDGIYQINLSGYQPEGNQTDFVTRRSFEAQDAYEMIKHFNGTLKLGMKDFSLGNEFEQWHYTHSLIWPSDDGVSADEYIERYIEFALAIRKAQDEVNGQPNSIRIWGPEFSGSWMDWNTGNFSKDCEWTAIPAQVACSYGEGKFTHFIPYFLSRLSQAESNKTLNPKGYKLLDRFAFHYYPNFRAKSDDIHSILTDSSGKQLVAEMLASTQLLNNPSYVNRIDLSSFKNYRPNIVPRMKKWLNDYYPTAELVLNEFALDSDYRTNNYHPIVRPLYLADTIGIMATEGVTFFNNFILSSPRGTDLPWSLIKDGQLKTNLFYMYKLFTNNFKGVVVQTKDNMGDTIKTYAVVNGSDLDVIVINKQPTARSLDINLGNSKLTTYTAPGWSVSVLKLQKNPSLFNRTYDVIRYGAQEMNIPLDRSYSAQ